MSKYVEVPRKDIEERLQKAGFKRLDVRGEVTYERRHDKDPRLMVWVYTSVPEFDSDARACGEDAIRIKAYFTWQRKDEDVPRRKMLHDARVYRVTSVEGVLERMIQRARDAYQACNEWVKENNQK